MKNYGKIIIVYWMGVDFVKINSKFSGVLLIILGGICITYSIASYLFRVTFAKFFSVIGLLFVLLGVVILSGKYAGFMNKHRKVYKTFKIVMIIFLVSLIVIEAPIIYYGFKKDKEPVDYIVVLGAGLWGESPSLALLERLEEGTKVIKENPNTKIVVSGGMGPGETITEAEAMKRYLVKNGVEEGRIIKEDKSRSTSENMEFTKKVIESIDNKKDIKIRVITNNFHMFRARLLAKHYGFNAYGSPATLHPLLVPSYYVREYMAVIKTLLFDIALK